MQTVIGVNPGILTVIFEFQVTPEEQSAVGRGIPQVVEDVVRKQAGFISANLHMSTDGEKVFNYFQWESHEAFMAFRSNEDLQRLIRPVIGPYRPKARTYDIAASFTATPGQPTVVGAAKDVFTVIFEFDIQPDQQQPLSSGIQNVLRDVVSRQKGFISANLHLSTDGEKVLNYFQWESQEAFLNFRNDEEKQRLVRPVIGPYGPKPRICQITYTAVGAA